LALTSVSNERAVCRRTTAEAKYIQFRNDAYKAFLKVYHSTSFSSPPPPCYASPLAPSVRTRAFFPSKGRNEADHGMLGTANNEANAWALYKKAAAHSDAVGP
jgi:hypothetical protein